MRTSKLIGGISTAFIIYFIILNQVLIFGKSYIAADEFQTLSLVLLVILYSLIASLERYEQYRLILIPFLLIVSLDILFNSLLFVGYPQYYLVYNSLRLPLAIFVGSIAFSYITFSTNPLYQSAISAASLTLAGVSSYVIFSGLSSTFGIPSLAIPSLALFLIFAITSLSNAYEGELAEWIRNERSFFILILFILTFYTVVIRPALYDRPGLANFFEWVVIAFTLIKLSRDLRRGIEVDEREVVRKHRLQNEFVKDELFSELEFGEKVFIDGGTKVPLLVSLIKALSNAGVDTVRIESIITPLVYYSDERIPLLSFPWERKIIEKKNKRRRIEIVEGVKKRLMEEVDLKKILSKV